MSSDAATLVALLILSTTVMAIVAFVAARRRAAREEDLARVASARGWKFESRLEKGSRVHRWTGTTDGVAWQAESLAHVSGGKNAQKRRHIARWHGAWNPAIHNAVVCMGLPTGKEVTGTTIAEGDGFFARLAQKAAGFAFDKAIDTLFGAGPGQEVDAATMHRIDGAKIPGFIVMAADKDEGLRLLADGFERALLAAANDPSSVLSDQDRPWILLRPRTVSLARMERFRDINELDAFVRAGVGLMRTSKFSRPFV
jgi:hypothetical protein